MFLIDTDTISEIIKGKHSRISLRAMAYLQTHKRFAFSLMTRYEVLRGLLSKNAISQLRKFDYFCRQSDILPITDAVIESAARHYARLRQSGLKISDADLLIAATAENGGRILVTRNQRHFGKIPGLVIEDWS